MIEMTLAEIADAVGGEVLPADAADVTVTGEVEYDTRKLGPGGLFLAFRGAHVDGHDFGAQARSAGAVGAVGRRPVGDLPTVVVPDTLQAAVVLARALLARLPDTVIVGLTGSSGKTTTKDFIGQVLAHRGPTIAPPGSYNNELGLPHTALRARADTRYLVLEMGSRGIGHIQHLCRIARPSIGAVLNVGVAHIGEFGSQANIALAKGELVEALPADGLAVLNADDPLVREMATRTRARSVLVGESADADVRAVDVGLDARGRAHFTLVGEEGAVPVRLGVTGVHQVGNALTAAAIGLATGLPLADVAAALAELRVVSTRRMDVFDRPDGVTVIDDSYNANPASAAAALRALLAIGDGRRRIAVLGYLAELGEHERLGHEEVGKLAARLGVDRLIAVGMGAEPIHDGAQSVTTWKGRSVAVPDQEGAIALLRAEMSPGDVVLVKGSRYRTWDVADFLREESVTGSTGERAQVRG